ncbi:MAG: hypothetical protein ACTHJR_13030 [Sphingomonas sp.]
MESVPAKKSPVMSVALTILLAPLALAFIVAASLSAGPSEVFKALTGRK